MQISLSIADTLAYTQRLRSGGEQMKACARREVYKLVVYKCYTENLRSPRDKRKLWNYKTVPKFRYPLTLCVCAIKTWGYFYNQTFGPIYLLCYWQGNSTCSSDVAFIFKSSYFSLKLGCKCWQACLPVSVDSPSLFVFCCSCLIFSGMVDKYCHKGHSHKWIYKL